MSDASEYRELDEWLAEHLFGWSHYERGGWLTDPVNWPDRCIAEQAREWSQTGDGMAEVIEAMLARGFGFSTTLNGLQEIDLVCFGKVGGTTTAHTNGGRIEVIDLPWHVAEAAKAAIGPTEIGGGA